MHVRAHAVLVSACTSDALGCVHASARAHAHGPSPPAARVGRRMIRYMQRLVATLARRYQSYPLSRATPFAWVACVVFFGVLYDGVLYDGLILTERCYRGPSTFLRLLVCGGLGQACGMSQPCRPTRRQGTPRGAKGVQPRGAFQLCVARAAQCRRPTALRCPRSSLSAHAKEQRKRTAGTTFLVGRPFFRYVRRPRRNVAVFRLRSCALCRERPFKVVDPS